MERSVEIVVAGAVQGVAFRWQASVEAERLGVRGWVRNEPDGTVRCSVEGSAGGSIPTFLLNSANKTAIPKLFEAVRSFVDWCRRGTRWSSVERVEVTDVEHHGYRTFEISG